MATVKLAVRGVPDAAAADALAAMLRRQPGIFGAVASPGAGCLEIDFEDDELSIAQLIAFVRDAGYTAELTG